MSDYRLVDRLSLPALTALTRTWPEVLASIARELPQGEAVRAWDWERPAQIDRLIRQVPVGPERRTA